MQGSRLRKTRLMTSGKDQSEEELGGGAAAAAAAASAAHADAREAYSSGRTKAYEWRKSQLLGVHRFLAEKEAELQSALEADLGKPSWESLFTEIQPLRNSCLYMLRNLRRLMRPSAADLPLHLSLGGSATIVPEPLGAALVISAWNYPLILSIDPLIAAIAAGNSVVLKPSEISPATAAAIATHLPSYLPDRGAVSVLTGGRSTATALLSLRWDKIFFTGSATVGRYVAAAAAAHLTPVTLELGGKSPTLVSRSADLGLAARRIAAFKWGFNAGQTCIAPDYVLVDRKVSAEFLRLLGRTMREFFVSEEGGGGAGRRRRLQGGVRIVNGQHYERLSKMVRQAIEGGAKEVKWWEEEEAEAEERQPPAQVAAEEEGELRMRPTILLNPAVEAEVMKEEIFGPILPVVEIGSVAEDGVNIVNAMEKALALYLFTADKKEAAAVVALTSSGSATVNDVGVQFTVNSLPFGGVGSSGMGSYHGHFGFQTFSHYKPVLRAPSTDVPFRYPPFTRRKQSLLSALSSQNYLRFFGLLLGLASDP